MANQKPDPRDSDVLFDTGPNTLEETDRLSLDSERARNLAREDFDLFRQIMKLLRVCLGRIEVHRNSLPAKSQSNPRRGTDNHKTNYT